MTVTGTGATDGTFTLNVFSDFLFKSNNTPLDLTTELVGQTVNNWGTCAFGGCGDFNIFSTNAAPVNTTTPHGVIHNRFILGTTELHLTSFRPSSSTPVPTPATLLLFSIGLIALAMKKAK